MDADSSLLLGYVGVLALLYIDAARADVFPRCRRARRRLPPGCRRRRKSCLIPRMASSVIAWHVPPRGDRRGRALSPRQRRRVAPSGRAFPRAHRRRHRASRASTIGAMAGRAGHPTEAGLLTDAETALWVRGRALSAARIAVWGESLGTGVAVALAAERPSRCAGARSAVHLDGRYRGPPLSVRAGALADEGPVPLGPAHRRGRGAAAGAARRSATRSCRSNTANGCSGSPASPSASCAFRRASTRISTASAPSRPSRRSWPIVSTEDASPRRRRPSRGAAPCRGRRRRRR